MDHRPVRVVVVSDIDFGGAWVACRRLVAALRASREAEVEWIIADGCPRTGVTIASRRPGLANLLRYRWRSRWKGESARVEQAYHEANVLCQVGKRKPDIIHLHNIHERMSFALVERLPRETPLVWTLHDMWPLTGGCIYSYACDRYVSGCSGDCPCGEAEEDRRRLWQRQERFYRNNARRLTFVGLSRWLADCVDRRLGVHGRARHILHALPLDVFRPVADKATVKRTLGLDPNVKVILAAADAMSDPRKGNDYLVQSLALLGSRRSLPVQVVAVGKWQDKSNLPGKWILPGPIRDEQLMNLYFNAADVHVLPSLADNLPNTLAEAAATGTPSVTFDVGGCPEAVSPGVTGFVARYKDAEDLGRQIERVLDLPGEAYAALCRQCRLEAEKRYDERQQAGRYLELYHEIREGGGKR